MDAKVYGLGRKPKWRIKIELGLGDFCLRFLLIAIFICWKGGRFLPPLFINCYFYLLEGREIFASAFCFSLFLSAGRAGDFCLRFLLFAFFICWKGGIMFPVCHFKDPLTIL